MRRHLAALSSILVALALGLAAPHARAADAAPRTAATPGSEGPLSGADVLDVGRIARSSDTVLVAHWALPPGAGAPGADTAHVRVVRVAQATMDRAWGVRFAEAALDTTRFEPGATCAWPDSAHRVEHSLLFTVTYRGGAEAARLTFRPWAGCVTVERSRRFPGSLDASARSPRLWALIREALPSDSLAPAPSPAMDSLARRPWAQRFHRPVETMPAPTRTVPPVYPPEATQAGVSGTVIVKALVGRDGAVRDAVVTTSIPMLDEAALASVRQWRFEPARSDGRPVAVWVSVPVRFTLH